MTENVSGVVGLPGGPGACLGANSPELESPVPSYETGPVAGTFSGTVGSLVGLPNVTVCGSPKGFFPGHDGAGLNGNRTRREELNGDAVSPPPAWDLKRRGGRCGGTRARTRGRAGRACWARRWRVGARDAAKASSGMAAAAARETRARRIDMCILTSPSQTSFPCADNTPPVN